VNSAAPGEAPPTASDQSMRDYYARRAAIYERIYHKPERQADLRVLETLLPQLLADRQVLEIACGTGYWTACCAPRCASWLATDLNPQTMDLARAKHYPEGRVHFLQADAYRLDTLPDAPFDAAFAGFWWSHVPLQRLQGWLDGLHARLPRNACVVFLDNRYVAGSNLPLTRRDAAGNSYQTRRLDDGSVHEVLKNFPERDAALVALGARARDVQWRELDHYWLLSYHLS
jgi:demethylmenaquinone methyltransferase/2-methoxy-6-polyprenyl-1,4-benzoquinol methylase